MSRAKKAKLKKANEEQTRFAINIGKTDMSEEMQKSAVEAVREAFAESKVQKDIAAKIKKKFDSTYPNTTWHCIVGNHFAE